MMPKSDVPLIDGNRVNEITMDIAFGIPVDEAKPTYTEDEKKWRAAVEEDYRKLEEETGKPVIIDVRE